jgi:hypothetical protein
MEITLQTFLLPQRLESLPVKNTVERPVLLVFILTFGQDCPRRQEPLTMRSLFITV